MKFCASRIVDAEKNGLTSITSGFDGIFFSSFTNALYYYTKFSGVNLPTFIDSLAPSMEITTSGSELRSCLYSQVFW
jgi:hypothetical protein